MNRAELKKVAKGMMIVIILSSLIGILSVKFHGG